MTEDDHAQDWKCGSLWDAAVLIVCGLLALIVIGGVMLVMK